MRGARWGHEGSEQEITGLLQAPRRTGAFGMVRLGSLVEQGFAVALVFSLRSRAAGCDRSCSVCVRSRLARAGFSDVRACR